MTTIEVASGPPQDPQPFTTCDSCITIRHRSLLVSWVFPTTVRTYPLGHSLVIDLHSYMSRLPREPNKAGRGGTCSLMLGLSYLRVQSIAGAVLHQEAVVSPMKDTVDWVYIMERIMQNCKSDASVQIHLYAEDDDRTCFGAGSNFCGTFWCNESWWDAYLITQLQLPSAHDYTGVISITAVFTHTLCIGDHLREGHGLWTIADITPTRSRRPDFHLVHHATQATRACNSCALWHWRNAADTALPVVMHTHLTKPMTQADPEGCVGCAMLLIAPGGAPGSRHSRRIIAFPSHNALCLCRVGPTARLAITTVTFD